MIKVIVFDLDGTLIDTDNVIINTWLELFRVYKPKDFSLDLETIRTFSGPPLLETIKKVFPEQDPNFIYKEYDTRTKKYYDDSLVFFDNCNSVLEKFKKANYKLAILTSKNRKMTEYSLKKMNTLSLFDYIVTSDDLKHFKPDPEGLLMIMDHFKVSNNEIISVGDTEFDYFCGKNAKVKTIIMTMKKRKFSSKIFPFKFIDSYNELYKEIINYDHQ
jgi:haloacid dehalogenase superfamily, subfamily IA, variant 1 with third motif having Dx(3-4)D or Dx(3-4)E